MVVKPPPYYMCVVKFVLSRLCFKPQTQASLLSLFSPLLSLIFSVASLPVCTQHRSFSQFTMNHLAFPNSKKISARYIFRGISLIHLLVHLSTPIWCLNKALPPFSWLRTKQRRLLIWNPRKGATLSLCHCYIMTSPPEVDRVERRQGLKRLRPWGSLCRARVEVMSCRWAQTLIHLLMEGFLTLHICWTAGRVSQCKYYTVSVTVWWCVYVLICTERMNMSCIVHKAADAQLIT